MVGVADQFPESLPAFQRSLLGLAMAAEAPTYDELYSEDGLDHPGTTCVPDGDNRIRMHGGDE
jgi:hypothetical protein